MSGATRTALASLLAFLLVSPPVRSLLESRMSLHMAVQLPLLLLCGWLIARTATTRLAMLSRVDNSGLFSATTASCVLGLWMVPAALDWAVIDTRVAWLKYLMWVGVGALLYSARHRFTPVIQAFFLTNSAWMTSAAGLLYLDAEQQLCVNYLVDDQQATGWALMGWGAALGACALFNLRPLLDHGHPASVRSANTSQTIHQPPAVLPVQRRS